MGFNTILSAVDRIASRIAPVNSLVASIVEKIAPEAEAAACTYTSNYTQSYQYSTCWASTSCGSNKCVKWYWRTYRYSDGSTCSTSYGQCDSRTCSSASQCG
ncbi:MAG TPA: hypothetical protein VD886_09940 [Herpetosiphonaceae bacterium]|nr:hypothetical protein [Herpetosiphonaceae bacterium]